MREAIAGAISGRSLTREMLGAGMLMLLASAAFSQSSTPASASAANAVDQPKYDPRDFTGVWLQTRDRPFKSWPLTPEYQAILDQRLADEEAGRPFQAAGSTCVAKGLVATMTLGGYPIEIFYQTGGEMILFQKEAIGALYRVYLGRPHLPEDELYPLFYGDSIGHWEGDTLVVDSISLGAAPALDMLTPHSDELHVVQRFRRVSFDTLEDELTVHDPKALTRPATAVAVFKRRPDLQLQEFQCTNERFVTDAKGNPVIVPSPQK